MPDMRTQKILFTLIKIIFIFTITFGILKGISLLPTERIPVFFTDRIVTVQSWVKNLEAISSTITETFTMLTLQRQKDRRYEILYNQLLAQKTLQDGLEIENTLLKRKLGFKQTYTSGLISAEIISRSPSQWSSFIEVNKGRSDGVRENMAFINESGLIGIAYSVREQSTQVLLISDPRMQISCMNQRTGEILIISGMLLQPLDMKYVTQHSDIQQGDILLTSGYSYRFRKGIPVGYVHSVKSSKNSLLKRVSVLPIARLNTLDIGFFIVNN
jgi:rod shape-determining protein MreC